MVGKGPIPQPPLPALPIADDAEVTAPPAASKRQRLATLLEGELDFHGADSGYASHDLHAFAAKFPPQLPGLFIRGLTNPGDVVLDPMMGSGTTILEALLQGRLAIGLDIDPLALRLSRTKTTPVDAALVQEAAAQVLARAAALLSDSRTLEESLARRFDAETQDFIDYWFLPRTQRELMALVLAIQEIADLSVRRFLELTFSSIIITKSGGVSRARDLAHSRPHRDENKVPRSALEQFALRLRRNLAGVVQLPVGSGTLATCLAGDARRLPLADSSVDLVVTSPPYANAIDYMRAHKFGLVWLGLPLGKLSNWRSRYIGSERVSKADLVPLPDQAMAVVQDLASRDPRRAMLLHRYFGEMRAVLGEIYRVLRGDTAAILVVGSSLMRGIDVQTHRCLAEIAASLGFDVVRIARRGLDRNRRMMPARFSPDRDSPIEQRIHEEYVIGLWKPA